MVAKKKPAKEKPVKKRKVTGKLKTTKLKTAKLKTKSPVVKEKLETKKLTGAPSKYKPEFAELAFKVCKEFGSIDKELAKFFEVSLATISNWKLNQPSFLDALKKGKDLYDCKNVEKSLLKRALGYEYTETVEEVSDTGGIKKALKKVHKKQMAPDVQAAMYWLQNRNSDRWKYLKYIDPSKVGEGVNWTKVGTDFVKAVKGMDMSKPKKKVKNV